MCLQRNMTCNLEKKLNNHKNNNMIIIGLKNDDLFNKNMDVFLSYFYEE